MESARLGVYEQLESGPLDAGELAARLNVDGRACELFLDALTALGLLEKEGDRYSNAPAAARYLVPDAPDYVGHRLIAANDAWTLWGGLAESLRTGEPRRDRYVFADDPEIARHLLLAIHERAIGHADALLDDGLVDPSGCTRMLDLGGGAGTYSIAFCRANAELLSTIVDLPVAAELAREIVGDAGLADRIEVRQVNFDQDPIPGSYDMIWVSNVLHGRSAEANRQLLDKLHPHLEAGGILLVHDIVMDEDRTRPRRGALFSLHMLLNNGVGRCYTYNEIREWLTQAGFGEIRRVPDHEIHQIVEARA